MNESFFLTRQTANLMEDFDRELKAGPALYLLYGETRVGKSRLLQELIKTRLGERRVHGIELRSSGKDGKGKQDRSAEIEKTFAQAKPGDIIIADHFESALKKTRHQLLVSWSTDGVDKELYMIICSSLDGFNELRELALRYHVSARSFRLKPLAADEIEAFLAFYLFPDQLVGKLNIPPYLQKQIAQTGGVIGELIDIGIRDGDQIENIPLRELELSGQRRWLAGTVVSIALLAIAFGWYFYSGPDSFDTVADVPLQPEIDETLAQAEIQDAGLSQAELEVEPEPEAIIESTSEPAPEAEAIIESVSEPAPEPGAIIESVSEPTPEPGATFETTPEPITEPAVQTQIDVEPASEAQQAVEASAPKPAPEMVPEPESAREVISMSPAQEAAPTVEAETVAENDSIDSAAPAAVDDAGAAPQIEPDRTSPVETASERESATDDGGDSNVAAATQMPGPGAEGEPEETALAEAEPFSEPTAGAMGIDERFERDLQTSLDWLDNRPDATGMVQIMLLNVSGFDLQKYYDFIDRLRDNGVDVSRVRIFKTMTGKRRTYSVFYEEYISRRAAMRGIPLLPKMIQDTSPIPRSVGGLWEEIRRLEANN